ncbi:MAG: helix-turn-helix domain-containing protein [Candidatus Contendobacter sp.]|nr:helix-turn-helix domain-containing protein [Candidatus Contendobacter sp.]
MNTIGQRIRALRQLRRMTQTQVAQAAGITPQAVSDIEIGKTKAPAYLSELARALNTTAEFLRYGDEIREPAPTYQADLDKITEIVTTGRLEPKEVKAIRQLAETLAL